MAFEYSDL